MRDADDRDDVPFQNIEDQVGSLSVTPITLSDVISDPAGIWIFREPFKPFGQRVQIDLDLAVTPLGQRVIGNLIYIPKRTRSEPIGAQALSLLAARFFARLSTSSTENSTNSPLRAC